MGTHKKAGREASGNIARERYEQAMIDADIEGLPRSKKIEARIAEWDEQGVSDEEQVRRLKHLFKTDKPEQTAAE